MCTKRLSAVQLFATALVLAGLAFAQTPQEKKPFSLSSVVVLRKVQKGEDALTRTSAHWAVRRVAPVSRDTFLCLIDYSKSQLDRWADEKLITKEKQENWLVQSVPLKTLESGLLLGLVHRSGRVIKLSTPGPHAPRFAGGVTWSQAVPVVLESLPECAYAILHPGRQTLECFDLQLNWTRSFEVPLHEIGFAKQVNRGETLELWVFGQRFPADSLPSSRDTSFPISNLAPEALGGILELPSGSWKPLPVATGRILDELTSKARGPDGSQLRLRQELLALRPFEDLEAGEPFWILATGVTSDNLEELGFQGARVFVRFRIGAAGLVAGEQVPFWVVQESRPDMVLDEKNGLIRVPTRTVLTDFQGFSLSPTSYGVYLRFAFQVADDRGKFPVWWEEADVLVLVTSKSLDRLVEVDDPTSRPWEDLRVRPFELRGRVGKRQFAFGAICRDRQNIQKRLPCFALMSLDE